MIKKLVLKLNEKRSGYWFIADARTMYGELEYIPLGLSENRNDFDVYVDRVPHKKTVFFYSRASFKKPKEFNFKTEQERNDFEQAYDRYYDKRWDDMPRIEMSLDDYEDLLQKWEIIKIELPQYVIFTLDDSGALDNVDVIGKNELSDQDLYEMKQEHIKSLKYEQARQKYMQNHPDYSYEWRGPQDDEYEADIMKYYEDKS